MFTTLIRAKELKAMQAQSAPLLIFDCSFDLMQPSAGQAQFLEQHIVGAQHADLDHHLSAQDAAQAINGGRHPLPQREIFAQWLRQSGLNHQTQVVVYDRNGVYAGRLWWMLKWCGHEAVAVLDGGLSAWIAAGGATAQGPSAAPLAGHFELQASRVDSRDMASVQAQLGHAQQTLIDARATPRFRGESEPLDPIAGHIPGALNRPSSDNFDANGFYKSAEQLRQEFTALLGTRAASSVVHQCGSGVSAIPNLLAMEIAGLGRTALYAGSWSEWSRTPGSPVEKG